MGRNSCECPSIPEIIILPNGDQVCAPQLNTDYQNYKLIIWMMEPLPEVIPNISDRQFFQQAAIEGFITQEEALAAVQTGTIPASLQAIVDTIQDPNEKFAAKMLLAGATTFQRNHPLTEAVGQAFGKTSEQVNTFFKDASLL